VDAAAAGAAATQPQPQAEPDTHCISWKPADPGWRQRSPAPKRGDWCTQDTAAPQGAVPINLSS